MYIDHFNALQSHIKSQLTKLKTVDWFNNQYERYDKMKATMFPACYIEFGRPVQWATLSNKLQTAKARIMIHLVVYDVKDSPVSALELAQQVNGVVLDHALVKEEQHISTPLNRTESDLLPEYDQLKVVIITYETTLYDFSSVPKYVPANASLVVEHKAHE